MELHTACVMVGQPDLETFSERGWEVQGAPGSLITMRDFLPSCFPESSWSAARRLRRSNPRLSSCLAAYLGEKKCSTNARHWEAELIQCTETDETD